MLSTPQALFEHSIMGSDTLGRMLGPGGQIGDVQGGGSSSGQ
jgi:hypothetical protein